MKLNELKEKLDAAFDREDLRESHAIAAPLLATLEGKLSFFEEIVLTYAQNPKIHSQGRINPVVAIPVLETPRYSIIAHGWIPRPDGKTNISHQSIHHHGNLLLTSLAAFGSGYESILFEKGYDIKNPSACLLKPAKLYKAGQGCLEFIDSHTPHVVFYPEELSVTYALWSEDRFDKKAALRKSPLLQAWKKPLKKMLSSLHLASSLGVNEVKNFDFSVAEGKICLLKERATYSKADHGNFAEAFFYLLTSLGFSQVDQLAAALKSSGDSQALLQGVHKMREAKKFTNVFAQEHLFLKDANLQKEELLAIYPSLRR